jgi:hypothetical protein
MVPKSFMKKFEPLVSRNESLDLEFPDWSGMDDSAARMTPRAAFRLCKEYLPLAGANAVNARAFTSEKCRVEFVL